jgi:hypothetical protein
LQDGQITLNLQVINNIETDYTIEIITFDRQMGCSPLKEGRETSFLAVREGR